MQAIVLGLVRHLLTIGGTALGIEGLAGDSNVNTVAGAVMILISVAGSIINKRKAAK